MTELKLGRIADQTPVKLSVSFTPELYQSLVDYAALYAATYGREESPAALVPAIVATFLQSDKSFARTRRQG